jgi:hypothetical protein
MWLNKEATQSKHQPAAAYTVQISSAAKAVMQEVTETAFQTQKEARSGDLQAKHLTGERGCC